MKNSTGFTLIEILVVLAVIAILSLLALPNKSGAIVRTQVAQSIKLIEDYKSVVTLIYKSTGQFPSDNIAAGLPKADLIKGNYVTQVDVIDGSFNIVFGAKIRSELAGKTISIRPIYVEGSPASPVSWICGNDTVPEGMQVSSDNRTDLPSQYLPISCR